jgi:hypothetical protein
MSLKLIKNKNIRDLCTEPYMNLVKATNLETILSMMGMVICSLIPTEV